MQVFIYEFVSGGGRLLLTKGPPLGLLIEGSAMRKAVAADFARAAGVRAVTLEDARLAGRPSADVASVQVRSPEEHDAAFARLAAESDWTLVIAPETAGCLADRCEKVIACQGRLLGPGLELVRLAADKHATAERLAGKGVPVPEGCAVEAGAGLPGDFPCPAVLKPRDGAGSVDVRRIDRPEDLAGTSVAFPARLERLRPGRPASVSFLCGVRALRSLPPCWQHVRGDRDFAYCGGSLPLPELLAKRAVALAMRAVAALPEPRGYLGVDLVLGPAEDGSQDVVLEVNPRLTTSYVGLRAAAGPGVNLAEAMLAVVEGREPELRFRAMAIEFRPDGTTGDRLA